MEVVRRILDYTFHFSENIQVSVRSLLFIAFILISVNILIKIIKRITNKRLEKADKGKFKTIFSFLSYFFYTMVIIISLESFGVEVSVLLAGSAALLVGLGLGLQTLFQDIISGIFILIDKSLHIDDIIEIEGKVGKVFDIKLRTTRAITIDDRVMVIPNHLFLTNSLFNWTQNGEITIESLDVGVAYGSDVEKVKQLLIEAAKEHPNVIRNKTLDVFFMDFGDSALKFRLLFTIKDSFIQLRIKSDLRYAIDKKFRENDIKIPFPQRDVHISNKKD